MFPWSPRPVIPVESLTIELNFPEEMNQSITEKQHYSDFSIRGYAAEMKSKNSKASNPFQFDNIPVETAQGQTQSPNIHGEVPDGNNNISDAADPVIKQLVPSPNAIDTTNNEDIDDSNKVTQEDTDDELFDDLMPLSKLRKTVTRSLPNILPVENTNSCDDIQRVVKTTLISGDLDQNNHEVDVAPHEVEDMHNAITCIVRNEQHDPVENLNNAMPDSKESQEHVSSIVVSCPKEKQLCIMPDLQRDEETWNDNRVEKGDLSTSTWIISFTRAPTTHTHGQILSNGVIMDANSPRCNMLQERDGSLGQSTMPEKSNDHVTNRDVEPTTERRKISSSVGQANVASGIYLKRGAERNHSLATKRAKSAQIPETFSPIRISESKSACVRSGDFKRSVLNSFGSSNNQPCSETGRIKSNFTQTKLQIRNSTTVKGGTSGTWLPTIDSHHAWNGSTRNQDGGEASSVQRNIDSSLAERNIPLPPSAQDLLKRRQVLYMNERHTPTSSCALPKGIFHEPNEKEYSHQQVLENQGPWKSNIQQYERRHGKAVVQHSSDDDIIQLMAKHQNEQTLEINDGSHLIPPRPRINTMRSFPEVQNIRDMEHPSAVGYSGSNKFAFPNAWSVIRTPTTNMGAEQGNYINNYTGRFDERQRDIFNAFQQNQQNISSRGMFSTAPAAASYVRPVSQGSVVLERSSTFRSTVIPYGPHSLQKFSTQTPGKTISDIKAEELKRTMEDSSFFPRSRAFNLTHEFKEPYSGDDISAMQFLNLRSETSIGSRFNAGSTSTFFNKPFENELKYDAEGIRYFPNGSMLHNQANGVHNAEQPFSFSGGLSIDPRVRDRLRERSQNSGYVANVLYPDIVEDAVPLRMISPYDFCNMNRNPAEAEKEDK